MIFAPIRHYTFFSASLQEAEMTFMCVVCGVGITGPAPLLLSYRTGLQGTGTMLVPDDWPVSTAETTILCKL